MSFATMLSDESLTELDESGVDIYSTKTITSTYYGVLNELKSSNESGKRTIVNKKDNKEDDPCTSTKPSGSQINLNDPCTSTKPSGSQINLNDPCTSKDASKSQAILDEPCTSKDLTSGSSLILDDSSQSTIISNNPGTSNKPSRNRPPSIMDKDFVVTINNPSTSTPAIPFTRITLRSKKVKKSKKKKKERERRRRRRTGTETEAGTSDSRQEAPEVEIIEDSPVPKRRRTQQIPELVELSDDDDSTDSNLTLDDEINYEVSVKVLWMSVTVKTFRLRRFQKFTPIFEYFMKEENVPYENILLKLKGVRVTRDDTPDSLDLKVYDFIDGGILSEPAAPVKQSGPMKSTASDENCLTIKVQDKTKIVRKLTINRGEKLKVLMVKYAEQTEIPLKNLKFYYDGEIVNPADTPDSLGLSNDEIIDVKY